MGSVRRETFYLYNHRNELAEALVGTNAFGYAYDSIGNRTSDTFNGVSRSYAANSLNQYAQVDAAQMAYDADGNLVRDDRFAYAYDSENRMLSARPIAPSEGDLAVVNAYGHKHRRIKKRVEGFDDEAFLAHVKACLSACFKVDSVETDNEYFGPTWVYVCGDVEVSVSGDPRGGFRLLAVNKALAD